MCKYKLVRSVLGFKISATTDRACCFALLISKSMSMNLGGVYLVENVSQTVGTVI